MAVKPRFFPGTVDMGDIKAISEEVIDEATEVYDLTYRTMTETFTDPLTSEELDELLASLDMAAFEAVVRGDPEAANAMLRSAENG
jgi:hypothetical protein